MDRWHVALAPTTLQALGLGETGQAAVWLRSNPVGTRICWRTQLSLCFCRDIWGHPATWDSPAPEAFQGLYSSPSAGFSHPRVMANFTGKFPQTVHLSLACGDPCRAGRVLTLV